MRRMAGLASSLANSVIRRISPGDIREAFVRNDGGNSLISQGLSGIRVRLSGHRGRDPRGGVAAADISTERAWAGPR